MKKPKPRKISIDRTKLRKLTMTKDPFGSLARSIISQQISTSAARSILARFVKLYPRSNPTPKKTLTLTPATLKSVGLSNQKVTYMKDLAAKFLDRTVNPKNFHAMSDDEIIDHLVQVKGIGVWTAHMFLIGALNRPDILPVGDLGIKKGFQKVFKLRSLPSEKKMIELAKPHAGERTYLSLHLWQSLDN